MNIDKFKQDHVAVLAAVTDLRKLVQAGVSENAGAIARAIVSMSSAIRLHLSTVDRVLYPALEKSADPAAVQLGRKFQAEMGGIATAYLEFVGKWNLEAKVAANPDGFRDDANSIFKALHQRIQRENQELYPLAERI